jgi:small subunit ribosomal protein S11
MSTQNPAAAAGAAPAASTKKKIRKNVLRGIVHVNATITDVNGETIAWDSAGTVGFKGARKSTPFAASRASEKAVGKAKRVGLKEVEVRVKGPGPGRESAITALQANGLRVTAVEDHTPIPFNGCRPPKKRRV